MLMAVHILRSLYIGFLCTSNRLFEALTHTGAQRDQAATNPYLGTLGNPACRAQIEYELI